MAENKAAGIKPTWWCIVDACPSFICQGPHRIVHTTLGNEILRADQEPVGTPIPLVKGEPGK